MLFDRCAGADQALAVDDAFARADQLTRRNSQTFYLATALLPRAARRAIRALYAFCRATDDLVDREGARPADVARWRGFCKRAPCASPPLTPACACAPR